MSSILQGLGSNNPVQRSQSIAPREERNKEGRVAGATPPNRDSYVPSNEAVMLMSVEEEVEDTLFDVMVAAETDVDTSVEDVDFVETAVVGDEVDVDGDEVDVDGDEVDVDGDEVDVDGDEELEVETKAYNSISVPVDSSDRTNGYMSSLSEEDLAMLQTAYQGFTTSGYSSSDSLFDYLSDSSSSSDWWSDDNQADYDSLLEALANANNASTETEDEVDLEESETDLEVSDSEEADDVEEVEEEITDVLEEELDEEDV